MPEKDGTWFLNPEQRVSQHTRKQSLAHQWLTPHTPFVVSCHYECAVSPVCVYPCRHKLVKYECAMSPVYVYGTCVYLCKHGLVTMNVVLVHPLYIYLCRHRLVIMNVPWVQSVFSLPVSTRFCHYDHECAPTCVGTDLSLWMCCQSSLYSRV